MRDPLLIGALAVGAGIAAVLTPRQFWLVLVAVVALVSTGLLLAESRGMNRINAVAKSETSALDRLLFGLMAVAALLVTYSAVRLVSTATLSDLVLSAALLCTALALLDPNWKIGPLVPTWLLMAAGLLLASAILVGIFPARPSQAALLFPGKLLGVPQWGGDPASAALSNTSAVIRFVGPLLVLPVLIGAAANSPRRITLLADFWIAGAALGGLLGVLAYAGVLDIGQLVSGRATGLTTDPVALGLASAMVLPVASARLGGVRGRTRLWFSAAVLALIAAIAVSGSRAALLGGVFGLLLVAVLHRQGRKGVARSVVALGLLVVVAGLALSASLPPALERLVNGSVDTTGLSTSSREEIYPAVWGEVLHRPLVGHGFEYIRGAHNIYLQLLHSGGILALTGFLFFAAGSMVTGFRVGQSPDTPPSLQVLATGSVASLAVWFVAGFVSNAIFDRYLYLPAGLILAIWAFDRRSRSAPRASPIASRPRLARSESLTL